MADTESSLRITGDVDDLLNALDRLSDGLDSLKDKLVNVNIDADTTKLDEADSKLNSLDGKVAEAQLQADDDLTPVVTSAENTVTQLDNMVSVTDLEANDNITPITDVAVSNVTMLDSMVAVTDLDANDNLSLVVDGAVDSIQELDGMSAVATAELEDNVSGEVNNVNAVVEELDSKTAIVIATLEDDASGELNEVSALADELDGREIVLYMGIDGIEDFEILDKGMSDSQRGMKDTKDESWGLEEAVMGIAGALTLAEMTGAGLTIDKHLKNIEIVAGASADELDRIRQATIDLSTPNIGPAELAKEFEYYASSIGTVNEALERMPAYRTLALRSETDLHNAIKRGSVILEQFDVPAENANQTLLNMAYAAKTSRYTFDEWANAMSAMGRNMSQWGMSAEQMMGIMKSLETGGARIQDIMRTFRSPTAMKEFKENLEGTDEAAQKARKALEELGVSITYNQDGTIDYGQTMWDISNALGNMESATDRGRLATEIFGERVGSTFARLEGAPSDYTNDIETMSEKTTSALGESAAEHRTSTDEIKKGWNQFLGWFSWIPTPILKVISWLGQAMALRGVIAAINKFTSTDWGAKILKALKLDGVVKGALQKFYNLENVFKGGFKNVAKAIIPDSILSKLDGLKNSVSSFLKKMGVSWGDDAGKAGGEFAKKIGSSADDPSILTRIKTALSKISGAFKGDGILGKIGELGVKIKTKFLNIFSPTQFDEAGNIIMKATNKAGTSFKPTSGLLSKIAGYGKQIINTFVGGLKSIPIPTNLLGKLVPLLKGASLASSAWALVDIRRWLIDFGSGMETGNSELDKVNKNQWLFFEGIQKMSVIGMMLQPAIDSFEFLSKVVDNLFAGKGWDSFGLAWEEQTKHIQDVNQGFLDHVANVFGIEIPSWLAPSNWGASIFSYDFGAMWNNFTSSITNLLPNVQAGLDGIVSWITGIPQRISDYFTNFSWEGLGYSIGAGIGNAIAIGLEYLYYFLKFLTELPGKAYNALMGLGTSITNAFVGAKESATGGVNSLVSEFWKLVNYLTGLPNRAYQEIMKLGQQIHTGIMSIPAKIKQGVDAMVGRFNDFVNWLKGLPKRVMDWVSKTFNDMVNYIKSIPGKAKAELDKIVQKFWDFINFIKSLPGKLYDAIVDALNGFVKGLKDKFPQIEHWLQKIRDLWPSSPPKAGPLKDIYEWGNNMADAIGSGIDSGFPSVVGKFDKHLNDLKNGVSFDYSDLFGDWSASNFKLDDNTKHNMVNYMTPKEPKINIDIQVNLGGITTSSKEEGEGVADTIVDTIIEKLKSELRGKGMSVYNLGA